MDQEKKNIEEGAAFFKSNKNNPGIIEHKSGIQYKIIKNSEGIRPNQSDIVSIHYIGKLIDGTKFDSSHDRGQPFEFPVGMGRVIKGWDEAFLDMKVGTKASLFRPPTAWRFSKNILGSLFLSSFFLFIFF